MDYILLMKHSLGNLEMTNTPQTKSTPKIQLVDSHTTFYFIFWFANAHIKI